MWQVNFCPKCGARAASGARFCSACGLDLTCVEKPVPPPAYDYHCIYQQWVPHSLPYNQAPAYVEPDRYAQRHRQSSGDTVTPLSAEISKLLADFFDRRMKYSNM